MKKIKPIQHDQWQKKLLALFNYNIWVLIHICSEEAYLAKRFFGQKI